jgi:lipopolysaccharide biosynthesis glycosyltransferase
MISVYDKSNIVFHIVACGSDILEAQTLVDKINKSLKECFSHTLKTQVVPFTLPRDSGFYLQMVNAKTKSHWTSSTGADMARFFFASIFSNVDRILYIGNDVLVTCCLEEIWACN